jgi:hypothetical protein
MSRHVNVFIVIAMFACACSNKSADQPSPATEPKSLLSPEDDKATLLKTPYLKSLKEAQSTISPINAREMLRQLEYSIDHHKDE